MEDPLAAAYVSLSAGCVHGGGRGLPSSKGKTEGDACGEGMPQLALWRC